MATPYPSLTACHCCGLIQRRPPLAAVGTRARVVCRHCGTPLRHCAGVGNQPAAALAAAALILYPPAILLPMLEIERLGYQQVSNLLQGIGSMFAAGQWLIGGLVLGFSLVLPFAKLLALLVLSLQRGYGSTPLKVWIFRGVESVGRWGMLDVLLVAVLIAFVKLGDLLVIQPRPGVFAFALMVLLSLAAALLFNPHCLWQETASEP